MTVLLMPDNQPCDLVSQPQHSPTRPSQCLPAALPLLVLPSPVLRHLSSPRGAAPSRTPRSKA